MVMNNVVSKSRPLPIFFAYGTGMQFFGYVHQRNGMFVAIVSASENREIKFCESSYKLEKKLTEPEFEQL